jgi:hypothetical protein
LSSKFCLITWRWQTAFRGGHDRFLRETRCLASTCVNYDESANSLYMVNFSPPGV